MHVFGGAFFFTNKPNSVVTSDASKYGRIIFLNVASTNPWKPPLFLKTDEFTAV